MTKLKTILILAGLLLLFGCPAPEYNHIIINQSETILEVEYEYVQQAAKMDASELANPAKLHLRDYENAEKSSENWKKLTAENELYFEPNGEEIINNSVTGEKTQLQIKKVNLKLLPNEVLRVFVSSHINFDLKNVRKINLRGENGKLEIEGAGFEQFSEKCKGGLLSERCDYRIIYH